MIHGEPSSRPVALVVTADEASRQAVSSALSGDFRLMQAQEWSQALEIATRQPIDLLVVDGAVAEMSGEFPGARLEPVLADVPVLLLATGGLEFD